MRIIIDSNEFIAGIARTNTAAERLLDLLPELQIVIPRVVMREVTRNLTQAQIKQLYTRIERSTNVTISDEIVPAHLVKKYTQLGLNPKGDAYIAAFAEWVSADYIISENRHFLRVPVPVPFEVVSAAEFLEKIEDGES